jgi:hypothetical protein
MVMDGCGGGLLWSPVPGVNIMEDDRAGMPDDPDGPVMAAWESEGMSFAE